MKKQTKKDVSTLKCIKIEPNRLKPTETIIYQSRKIAKIQRNIGDAQ
jgi:hypothetical protein